jgi:hypothetical protein
MSAEAFSLFSLIHCAILCDFELDTQPPLNSCPECQALILIREQPLGVGGIGATTQLLRSLN